MFKDHDEGRHGAFVTQEDPSPVARDRDERGRVVDVETFATFFEETHQRLFTVLCLVTGDRHEAEEIAQDAYLRILERWDRASAVDDREAYRSERR